MSIQYVIIRLYIGKIGLNEHTCLEFFFLLLLRGSGKISILSISRERDTESIGGMLETIIPFSFSIAIGEGEGEEGEGYIDRYIE